MIPLLRSQVFGLFFNFSSGCEGLRRAILDCREVRHGSLYYLITDLSDRALPSHPPFFSPGDNVRCF